MTTTTPQRASPTTRGWLPAALPGAALALLALLVYWPTLSNGFIWDDDVYVQGNPTLRTLVGLRDIWFRIGAVPQYYPLVHTTFWVEFHLWELAARGYHAVNLALHATAAILAWRVLTRLAVPGAWLAAAIFAVHPVGVESVAWITERKNVLSLPLALGAMLAYLRFQPAEAEIDRAGRNRWGYYALALALFLAALLSKSVTASLPAVLLVVYWWKRGRLTWGDARPLLPFFAIGLAMALLTVRMEKSVVGAAGAEWDLSPLDRLLVAGRAAWFYLGKLLWPDPLIFFYPRWQIDAHAWWQYAYPLAALAVLIALYVARGRIGRGPLAAALIFVGVLTPALGFFDVYPFRYSFVADHFQYHAYLALVALAAAAVTALTARARAWWVAPLGGAALLVPLALVAHQKTFVYHDLETLYLDTLDLNPDCWVAHLNLGYLLVAKGEVTAAGEHYRAAVALSPRQGTLRVSLATALHLSGDTPAAMRELDTALAGELSDFDRSIAHVHYGIMFNSLRQHDAAIEHFQRALALQPKYADAMYHLGSALAAKGDLPGGIARVRQALAIEPNSPLAQNELGNLLLKTGEVSQALVPLRRAVQLSGDNPALRKDLGRALIRAGDLRAAENQLRNALRLNPNSADALNFLGVALVGQHQLPAAIEAFQAALRLSPRHAAAAENLKKAQAGQN